MKILFICRANVGRSQIAESLFNNLSKKHKAGSAGTKVKESDGQTILSFAKIKPPAKNVIRVMSEEGINIENNIRKQVNKKMLNGYDKIIVLASKQECPDYLLNNSKTIFWDIEDAAGKDYDFHIKTRDIIKKKIKELLIELK